MSYLIGSILVFYAIIAATQSISVLICANQTEFDNQRRLESTLAMNGYDAKTFINENNYGNEWIKSCLKNDKSDKKKEFIILLKGFNFLIPSSGQQLLFNLDKLTAPVVIPSPNCSREGTCSLKTIKESPTVVIGKRSILKELFFTNSKWYSEESDGKSFTKP
ncbi:hypothetical protein ACOME3_001595 [Neoechinorhynchus agilis]